MQDENEFRHWLIDYRHRADDQWSVRPTVEDQPRPMIYR
jgi:hypothetical protein